MTLLQATFYYMAGASVASALLAVTRKNPVHSMLWVLALFLHVAGIFLLLALAAPAFLGPLNRLWTKFGLLLHRIVNPVVLGLMFYIAVVPVALIMRLLGKDPLQRRFDPQADSYWQPRNPPGPAPKSMVDQF